VMCILGYHDKTLMTLLLKQAKQMAVRFGRQEEDGHMASS